MVYIVYPNLDQTLDCTLYTVPDSLTTLNRPHHTDDYTVHCIHYKYLTVLFTHSTVYSIHRTHYVNQITDCIYYIDDTV